MPAVRATERLRLDAGEHQAISVVTTDSGLLSEPWVSGLTRFHISLEHVAIDEIVPLAAASDVVVLPMTASASADSLLLVPRLVGASRTPILLAVERGCERAAAQAVDAGAAEYMFLPYRRTTVIRLLRKLAADSQRLGAGPSLQAGNVTMDVRRREVTVDGLVVPMPRREFDLLRLLLERPGEPVTTQDIMTRLWPGAEEQSRTLSVHVRRLRERLESDPSRPELLLTVRGVGYRLHAEAID